MAESEGYSMEIIDHCRVSPPPNSVPSSSLPLTFFDIPWLFLLEESSQLKNLVFYEYPGLSTSSFTEDLLPVVKHSLSQSLQKYYPMAAKLVVPPLPATPEIVYTDGDSVSLVAAVATASFDELSSDNPKDVKLVDRLIPKLSPSNVSEDRTIVPDLFAMQITLFPNTGVALGFQNHHAVCDGGSLLSFLRSLAMMFGTGKLRSPPYLTREVIEDPNDRKAALLKEWSEAFSIGPKHSSPLCSYADLKVTFQLPKEKVNRLKDWIMNRSVELGHKPMNISSFAAVCASTWVCLVKSKEKAGQVVNDENQRYHFGFTADCRSRLNLPENYFGNCLAPCFVTVDKKSLFGQHGIVIAARAIAESAKRVENIDGIMKEMERWCSGIRVYKDEPSMSVAGSTRLKGYEKSGIFDVPRKFEMVHINSTGAISLMEGKEEGSVEMGVALDRVALDKFTTLFEGLDSFV